MIDGVTLTFDL